MFEHMNPEDITSVTVERIEDPTQLRRALGIIRHRARRLQDAEVPPSVRDELARIEWLCLRLGVPEVEEAIGGGDPAFPKADAR